ncbi:MAG: hypothetical protein ACJAST_003343 [Halopseudomonas sp.]|jgi:hypothetical protein
MHQEPRQVLFASKKDSSIDKRGIADEIESKKNWLSNTEFSAAP